MYVIRMLILYVLPVAEYTGICYGYLTACCHQASSSWRLSELVSHYQTVMILNILRIWHV
ncbi:hypothetical protein F383_08326 [Gossypium arboreum]|uniref:Uncharacterized protein n=1 Tax=Gossypium arboreum TaxID=29729 RepID=A0A0B0P377_GOSAR|nr:hypothetical protein F383_08326 [Gossypium arboreum]